MDAKKAHDIVRERQRPCPCCGAALMVAWESPEQIIELLDELYRRGARWALFPAEEAEESIREYGAVQAPVPGRPY